MPKRLAGPDDGSPHSKRQRLTEERSSKTNVEDLLTAERLQTLLAFDQDAGPETKRKIQTFKSFLESIIYGQDSALQSSRRNILRAYFDVQPISKRDENPAHAFDLIKTWSFAAQCNNEALYSAVAAVLALLLKTISHHIEFQEHGRSICHLLLQTEHVKLFEKGLSAQKSKDHLISACLRLLTEIVSFDGGSSAKRVYRSKDITFKRLDTFLGIRPDNKIAISNSRRKPSVRNLSLRYLSANLRLQDPGVKIEILGNGRILRSVLQEIKDDSQWTVSEVLTFIRDDILKDDKIPRRIKARLFTEPVLGCIASLYGYRIDTDDPTQDKKSSSKQDSIPDFAHDLLLSICTQPEFGVLLEAGRRLHRAEGQENAITGAADDQGHVSQYNSTTKPRTVKNVTLALFLQTLRPYANELQRDLILATFQAAPELVSDYFQRKKSFLFEPKLTATWIGFAAFLFHMIRLPVDPKLTTMETRGSFPPPAADIIESILPLPLSIKALSRCLTQNVNLVKLLTIKILTAAFGKLAEILNHFRCVRKKADLDQRSIWDSAISSLVAEIGSRYPDMSHVITVFRSCAPEDMVLREASARLLLLYYQHLPQIALQQKFDASLALSTAFGNVTVSTSADNCLALQELVLEHLINVARYSPDIRWWQRSGNEKLSLFGTGLQLHSSLNDEPLRNSLRSLLQIALCEAFSLGLGAGCQLLTAVLRSLTRVEDWQPTHTLLGFLDECLVRLSKKTVKYEQDLSDELTVLRLPVTPHSECVGGELLIVAKEQWPFIQESVTLPDLEQISRWLSRFLLALKHNGGVSLFLEHVRKGIQSTTARKRCQKLLKENLAEPFDDSISDAPTPSDGHVFPLPAPIPKHVVEAIWQPPERPASEDEDHPGLSSWKQYDVEEAVVEGAVGDLMLCFCSKHGEIRKQALNGLRTWMRKLQGSQYGEKETLYLLAGEVSETAKGLIDNGALPYFVGVAAAQFCLILSNPLHHMYAKVNKFLNKAPTWTIAKMPSYWVDQVLMRLPTRDDAHYKEIEWLLDLLIEGLRTEADMELYRRCHIVERLLSLLASPSLQPTYQDQLLTLLLRYCYVGGSTTLITRYSLLSWAQCMQASGTLIGPQGYALKHLTQLCLSSCDRERVGEWSGGKIVYTQGAEQINGTA